MSTTIESLELEVLSSSQSAESGLNALTATLEKLKNATKGGAGLTSVIKQIKGLGDAAKTLDSSSVNNLNGLTKAISILSNLGGIKLSSSIATQITAIGNSAKSLNGVNFTPFTELATALQPLTAIGKVNLSSAINQLTRIPQMATSLSAVDMSGFSGKIRELVTALEPLSQMPKQTISSTLTQIKKIPEIFEGLKKVDMVGFSAKIKELTVALKPLADEMNKIAAGFSAFPKKLQKMISSTNNLSASTNKASHSFKSFIKSGVVVAILRKATQFIGSAVTKINEYIENVNLFTVSLGKFAEEANAYAEKVGDLMGIDPGEWMRNQGIFMTLATGFGVVSDRAYIMSQQLTQLGYDLSSFFNISYEDAMLKLQSGLSGELEPLRRLGYDLSQAKLEATALELGITKTVSAMTQAEKAQLRYYAIMTQVTTAQGDMSRTLEAPSNQLRILKAQVEQAGRAIGSIFIPALNAVLPYCIAVAKVIRHLAEQIANLFGFEMPEIDYSGIGQVAGDVSGDLDDATASAKKLKTYLLGFDELNVFDPNSGSGASAEDVLGQFDFELPTYDFIGDATSSRVNKIFDDIMKNIKKVGKVFEPVAKRFDKFFKNIEKQIKELDWGSSFENFITTFGESFVTVLTTVQDILFPVIEALHIPTVVITAIDTVTAAFESLGDIVEEIKPILDDFTQKTLVPMAKFVSEIVVDALKFVQDILTDLGDWVGNTDSIGGLIGSVGDLIHSIWVSVEPVLTTVWNGVKQIIDAVYGFVKYLVEILAPVLTFIVDTVTKIIDTLRETKVFKGISDILSGIFDIVSGILTLDFTTVLNGLGDLGYGILQSIQGVGESIQKGILEPVGKAVGEFFFNFAKVIYDEFMKGYNQVVNIGTAIIDGIWQGLQSVWKAITDFVGGFVQGFKNALGIHSPSTVFAEIGRYLIDGLFSGMNGAIGAIGTWCYDNIIKPITDAISGALNGVANFIKGDKTGWLFGIKSSDVVSSISKALNDPKVKEALELKMSVKNNASSWWSNVKNWWNIAKGTLTMGAAITNNSTNWWSNVKKWWDNANGDGKVSNFTTNVADSSSTWWSNVKKWWKTDSSKGVDLEVNAKKGWTGTIEKALGLNKTTTLGISLPKVGIEWGTKEFLGFKVPFPKFYTYAQGGFPDMGQLFVAREAGAELVGNIGGKTAVVNNDQIVESVSSGVYQAVIAALGNGGSDDGNETRIVINLDGEKIYENQQKVARNRGYNLGMGVFSFG